MYLSKNVKRLIYFTITYFGLYLISNAQGCSDAGFCTMGALRPDQSYDSDAPLKLRFAEISYYNGQTRVSADIQAVIIDFGIDILQDYNLHVKLPYMYISGNFGENHGLGDISLSLNRNVGRWKDFEINATLGAKIATGNADDRVLDRQAVLPMYYQTTLGTHDFIVGASLINEKWLFATGYQQPLVHINNNSFTGSESQWAWYEGGMDYVIRHANANQLRRGADVMLRAERNFRFSRFNANIGLLPIYRITNDQIMNEDGAYEKVEGGRGLAASLLIGCGYRFNVHSGIKLLYGLRLIDRIKNPDGLSRESVLNVSFYYNF